MMGKVFISYAREDKRIAERLYMDLRKEEIDVWLDTKCLLPGQDWKFEIKKAIRESKYFIALISEYSLNKRGYVQRELREGLELLKEIPKGTIFLIPVKLDNSSPEDEELRNLNWLNLFESYSKDVNRILTIMTDVKKEPLEYINSSKPIGLRAPIDFMPFTTFPEFVREFLKLFPESTLFFDREHSIYFTLNTRNENLKLPKYLKKQYPDKITFVLQNQFQELTLFENYFSVILSFNNKKEKIIIPYESVIEIFSPSINIRISRI